MTFFIVSRVLVARLTGVSLSWQLRVLASGALAATATAVTALAVQAVLGSLLSEGWQLLLALAAAAPAGFGVLWARERHYVKAQVRAVVGSPTRTRF